MKPEVSRIRVLGERVRTCSARPTPSQGARQHDIGEQQVELFAGFDVVEGGFRGGGGGDLEAELAKHPRDGVEDALLVLDDEAPEAGGRPFLEGERRLLGFLGGALGDGEEEADGGAAAGQAVDGDVAAGLPGEAVDHAEAHAAALADGLRGEEGLEDAGEEVGGDALAAVADADDDVAAGADLVLEAGAVGGEA